MRILAISQLDHTKDGSQLLSTEAKRTWELYDTGIVREMYWKTDNSGAVFVMEAENVEQAQQMVASLPFVEHAITRFTYIPIQPLEELFPR